MLAALRRQGLNQSGIARSLGRHCSTVCREVRRNSTRADGHYRAFTAQERTNGLVLIGKLSDRTADSLSRRVTSPSSGIEGGSRR
jgi:IS30 family transposase